MKMLLLLLILTACAPMKKPEIVVCPPTTVNIQTDEAIRLRQDNAELMKALANCDGAYFDIKKNCPNL